MKKWFITIISTTLLVSCGQIANTVRGSLDINNFTRADAIRVFECSINKEKDTSARFSLEAQLALNKNLSDEAWQKLVDLNKQNAFDGVNNVAKKYNCF
jgi:hypothetical protein